MPEITLTPRNLSDIAGAQDIVDEYSNFQLPDYQALIDELQAKQLALLPDPSSVPLTELNKKIEAIDAHKARAATILTTAIENETNLNVISQKAHILFKREFDRLLPQDPVRGLPNKELREAACNTLLQDLKALVDAINGSLMQAKAFTQIAKTILDKLDSTNKNISRQITVLQLQMDIGELKRGINPRSGQNPYTF